MEDNYIPPQPVQPAPVTPAEPVTTAPPQIPEAPEMVTSTKKPFPKKLFIWLGVLMLLVLTGFVIFKLFSSNLKSQSSELVWWGLWEDENLITPLIEEYQVANPNVKVTYIKQSQRDYRERLVNALAKGQGPDIFRFHNSWVPMFSKELDSLPSSVMSASEFADIFYPIATSDLTNANGIVGIPLEYDALMLFVNEDIFAKAGKTPPQTWDDLRVLARELTVKDDQGIITQSGVALGRVENVDHWPEILALMMIQNGVDLSKPTGETAEDAIKFFSIFSTVDGVWDGSLPTSTQSFAGGKLAMLIAPSWRAFEIIDSNPSLKFKTYPVPQLPKEDLDEPDITYASYWSEGVWTRSSNKEAAWKFLKFLSTRESLEKLYQNASKVRAFGEPYPRVDMAQLLTNHPYLDPLVKQAPTARSWYLQSRTWDGPTGINSLLNKYFEDAVTAVVSGKEADKSLETAAQGVTQVLSQYRLVR